MISQMERTKSILVIDDEPMMLQLLKSVFVSEGYDVNLAADGVMGMFMLRNNKPDLVLLDILMPGPDGHLTLERIRHESNVPVIMVTGKQDVESLQTALALGADDYVRKPFRPVELVERVQAKIKRAEMTTS